MIKIIDRLPSSDGSIKYAFRNRTKNEFESVYFKLPPKNNVSTQICISSQAGCAMGCKFCATGYGGFFSNLTPQEMMEEVNLVKEDIYQNGLEEEKSGFNILLMGMGEALMNYENVIDFYSQARKNFFHLNKIFISTVGISKRIYDLANLPASLNIKLYVSIHSPYNNEREKIMPITKKYKIESVLDACEEFSKKTNTKVKANYLLLKGVNDSEKHAKDFRDLLNPNYFEAQIQLYNSTPDLPYQTASNETAYRFQEIISENGIETVVRISKGRDINGGCGQLVKKINQQRIQRRLKESPPYMFSEKPRSY